MRPDRRWHQPAFLAPGEGRPGDKPAACAGCGYWRWKNSTQRHAASSPRSAISAGTTFGARWSAVIAADVIVAGSRSFSSSGASKIGAGPDEQAMMGEMRLDERKTTGGGLASGATRQFGCKRRCPPSNFVERRADETEDHAHRTGESGECRFNTVSWVETAFGCVS